MAVLGPRGREGIILQGGGRNRDASEARREPAAIVGCTFQPGSRIEFQFQGIGGSILARGQWAGTLGK